MVLEVLDLGVVPLPEDRGSYLPEDNQPLRTDLRPLDIVQPEGVSFTLDGNLLTWQRWSMRVSMDPLEGWSSTPSATTTAGGVRPILHRASISEMVVPYGDPGPMHGWKNAFDVGEWGLGRMANSLALGCDCLGAITYLDAIFASEHGTPYVVENAICIHEEDYGILWKHNDMNTGRTEVRRSRRLVVSSIATVGNYEYGFYWYFYLDGTIQLEVKLTGIMSTQAVAPGEETAVRVAGGARAWPRRSTSTCSAPGSTSTRWTARSTRSTRSPSSPIPPARTTRGAMPSASAPPGWSPSARPSATWTRPVAATGGS